MWHIATWTMFTPGTADPAMRRHRAFHRALRPAPFVRVLRTVSFARALRTAPFVHALRPPLFARALRTASYFHAIL